jgi:hypothetical protein
MMLVSERRTPFDPSGIVMDGHEVELKSELKVTGFLFDRKLLWGPHIAMLAKKAKQRVGAMKNLAPYVDSINMEMIYITFIRSILEYGGVLFMGAKPVHLDKLDAIQHSAQKIGNFEVESLGCRRKAAAITLALKMLDGNGKPGLLEFAPELIDGDCIIHSHNTTHKQAMNAGLRLNPLVLHKVTLDLFKESFLGSTHEIWNELPSDLIMAGRRTKWARIEKECKIFLRKACQTEIIHYQIIWSD